MAQCQVCKASGANMKRCKECGSFWCANCARQGKGHYLKTSAANKCSYCGKLNKIETMK
jgi:hypothetical protein